MSALKDLTGQRFGRLVVVRQAEDYVAPSGRRFTQWVCNCDCGTQGVVKLGSNLTSGFTKSCGCIQKESGIAVKKYNEYDLSGNYGIGYTFKGEEFYFDLEDYDLIKEHCWHIDKKGYVKTSRFDIEGKECGMQMHRLIMNLHDDDLYVDHIHGNKTRNDNRKSNLRIVTDSQNMMNRCVHKNNKTGVAGVRWHKYHNKWVAVISANKKRIHLGYYDNFEDAVKARKEAEKKYFGEYAYDTSIGAE